MTSAGWPREGMTLLGRAEALRGRALRFAPDLAAQHRAGRRQLPLGAGRGRRLCRAPRPRPARGAGGARDRPGPGLRAPTRSCSLDLAGGGHRVDRLGHRLRARLRLARGRRLRRARAARPRKGVAPVPGLYFLGLPWLSRRGSAFIWGVWATPSTSPPHRRRPRDPAPTQPPDPRSPMAHTRIRPFNTRDTYPEQRLDNDLAQAVVARGATVCLRGQCPQDLDTGADIDSHDPVEQTHKVMQNILQLIEEAGAEPAHLVQAGGLPDRRAPPRGGLPDHGRDNQRRPPRLDRARRPGARPAGLAGRDRRHGRDPD